MKDMPKKIGIYKSINSFCPFKYAASPTYGEHYLSNFGGCQYIRKDLYDKILTERNDLLKRVEESGWTI